MSKATQRNSEQAWVIRKATAPVVAPRWYSKIIRPVVALVALSITFAWVAFLGWCVWLLLLTVVK